MSVPALVILLTIAYLRIRSLRDRKTSEEVARAKVDFCDRGSPIWFTGDQPQFLRMFPRPAGLASRSGAAAGAIEATRVLLRGKRT
jgi:hypothetical protein